MTVTEHQIAVLQADDLVTTTLTEEAITEPVGAGRGLKRVLTLKHESASVGFRIIQTNNYRDAADSKGWGALIGVDYTEGAL